MVEGAIEKLQCLLVAGAGLDAAEGVLPGALSLHTGLVEIEMRNLGGQVLAGAFHAYGRQPDLDEHFFLVRGREIGLGANAAALELLAFGGVVAVYRGADLRKRLGELGDEEELHWPAPAVVLA